MSIATFRGRQPAGTRELISLQQPSSGSKVTISGLDGNTDETYEVELFIKGSLAAWGKVKPNDTDASVTRWASFNGAATAGNSGDFLIGANNKQIKAFFKIHAKSGLFRMMTGHTWGEDNSAAAPWTGTSGWVWADTSTNITSIAIEILNSSIFAAGSRIALYRVRET